MKNIMDIFECVISEKGARSVYLRFKSALLVVLLVGVCQAGNCNGSGTAVLLANGCGFNKEVLLDRFPSCGISVSCSLDELSSGRGEEELYKPCEISSSDVQMDSVCVRRAGQDAWDARASVTNLSSQPRFLRLVFRARVPGPGYRFWNGYLNQSGLAEKLQAEMDYLRMGLFPAIAAIGKDASLVLGMDPMMLAARVDTSCVKLDGNEFLQFAFPVYLPPGEGFSARMTVASSPARYLWHDVVETWYGLFPAAFAPADKIHPGLYYPEANYLFWSPGKYGIKKSQKARREALRKVYGDRPCWDWCYKPFVRGGDWAISDKWCVGWNGFTKEKVEAKRADSRMRMSAGEALNVAPMWYLNVCWTERDMGLKEFPGIEINSQKTKYRRCWDQDTMRPVYCAGNTPYEKLFRDSIARIPKEYPEAKGIGWDSCFAGERLPESHLGFNGTPCKSFCKGEPFVYEAIGVSGLLDFNHEQFSGQYRMANAVNHKLAAPWMVSVRSDAVLFEGTPVSRPVLLWLHESLRARLGPRKVLTWHKGCDMKMLEWVEFDKMPPELRDDAHRQILDDLLFLCYYRGTVPAAMIHTENRERLVSGVTELMDLVASGWHPSPACDAPEGILVARYGAGAATRLAVINPCFEMRDTELFLPGEYWPEYKEGKKIQVSVSARHVMIVDPATDASRPAKILPPAPVKKTLEKGLMKWMELNGLLSFYN